MTEPHELTALEQYRLLQRGEIGAVELTQHYLERIERLNPRLGAFHTVTGEAALQRAEVLEQTVPRSARLWGLPFADKDLWRRRGVRTTFGSRAFSDFVPDASDELPTVLDEAGAISLGKSATPEFGMPSYTETRVAPPTRNPWNLALGAGGSSGGAAVAVAAGLLPFAPGSDGGGSIRIPAAACGLVGLKPSRGRVPALSGIDSLGGLPTAGPIARTVADAALLLDGMIGRQGSRIDDHFALRAPEERDGDFLGYAVRGEGRFQLGVCTDSPWSDSYDIDIEPDVLAVLSETVELLSNMGHGIERVSLQPYPDYAHAFRSVWQAGATQIPVPPEREALLEPLTLWLIEQGRALSAADLAAALATLNVFERSVIAQFSRFDAVVMPTLAQSPRPIGWYDDTDPERNFEQQVQYTPFTSFVNVAGLPAISLPVGEDEAGLPVGVQLVGRPGGESVLLSIARQLERQAGWEDHRPPIWSE
jgi:amidase